MSHFGGGREDCWSEGGTASLVEAWGERYLQLNRGNLRQKDWSDVANAVNARHEILGKPRKTDVQCKNRIDTVKKKYKSEKSKRGPSQWPFFSKLDFLIGPSSFSAAIKKPPASRPPALTFTVKSQNPNSNTHLAVFSGRFSSRSRMLQSPESSESSGGYGDEELNDDAVVEGDPKNERLNGGCWSVKRKPEGSVECERGGGAFGDLASAIVNFAEVYERVEKVKQQQMMELERQRLEFAKDIEFQRMKMFMEAQIEIEKMKRQKCRSGFPHTRLLGQQGSAVILERR